MTDLHLVVPDSIDDPARPSGGNVYDRRLQRGLTQLGWSVHEHLASGTWPDAGESARRELAGLLGGLRDASLVVVDGLVGAAAPEVLVPEAQRLRLVILVHKPLGLDGSAGRAGDAGTVSDGERAVLAAAAAVVTTSGWTQTRLLESYELDARRVQVAEPGVDAADLAAGSASGGSLLCVAAVSAHKGHGVLLDALARLRDQSWTCRLVGTLTRDNEFVAKLRHRARSAGIADRLCFAGPLVGRALDEAYAAADALVLASYAETYGMVVTEALARGLPVVATSVGGVPDALGSATDGTRPGLLVPAGDPAALTEALRRWLDDAGLRDQLRAAAQDRRAALGDWDATARTVARVLSEVAA